MEEIKILSVENCHDIDYGASIVQYQAGDDFISFAFSNINTESIISDPTQVLEELKGALQSLPNRPLWSDLSKDLRDLIEETCFDMLFIEYDDPDWSVALADSVWHEVVKHNLSEVVTRDENDCYLTLYAGAMGEVNWRGHPLYGKPYLEKEMSAILKLDKRPLDNLIQSAASRAVETQEKGNVPALER